MNKVHGSKGETGGRQKIVGRNTITFQNHAVLETKTTLWNSHPERNLKSDPMARCHAVTWGELLPGLIEQWSHSPAPSCLLPSLREFALSTDAFNSSVKACCFPIWVWKIEKEIQNPSEVPCGLASAAQTLLSLSATHGHTNLHAVLKHTKMLPH